MELVDNLDSIKIILEKEYGLAKVKFGNEFDYEGERRIPGFSFTIKNPRKTQKIEEMYAELEKKVRGSVPPNSADCYLRKRDGHPGNYREVHVIVKKGSPYFVLCSLAERLLKE
jgi:hypothetical protein